MTNAALNKPGPSESRADQFWKVITSVTFVGVVIFAFSLAGIGVLIYAVVTTIGHASPEYGLPILALLSVLLLLGALLIFTTLIHTIGLSDKNFALGLPDGSVRALLALALVGLFAVLASSVLVSKPTPAPLDDFGKQMLTLVGTLMTAVISFYFGSTGPATPSPAAGPPSTSPAAGPATPSPAAGPPTASPMAMPPATGTATT